MRQYRLFVLNEERFDRLSATQLNQLRRLGDLCALYAHLLSLSQIEVLSPREQALGPG